MKSKSLPLLSFLFVSFFTPLLAQNFDVYISDAGGFTQEPWQILKFDQNGGNGEVFISDHLSWPQDIFFIESDNTVLVSNLNTNVISKFNATTGDFIGEFATGIGGPTRMELGPDSLLYVLQWTGNGKVKRYKLDGTFVDDFTTAVVDNSIGLAWDTVGNLYVSSYNGRYVKKFSPAGADLGKFISTNLAGPTNIWFGENGDLFVSDWNAGSVKRFDSQGNYIGVFISGVPQVEGVDFFPNGDIAIGVGGASTVKVYSPEGNFIKNLIPAGALNLQVPNAVVFRPVAPTSALEVFKDAVFVTPSVGNLFQVSNPDALQPKQFFEVYNATGMLVMKFNFSDSTTWDASNLANGIYHLTAKLPDGTVGRQKVVVQR
ncbi:MAG: T9SS type A sorting domain-containing protein [Lewinellaceae bacterium]|nr:T9SS type A sorting domain-containing protein [Saprospiraceae bacterium]MCB9340046.1 T9SS type A sorting domain-containing protein [Lewinellaceae bacterium]